MNGPGPWRLRHVDLSGAVPDLPAAPGAQGLLCVFWWRDVPLGQAEVPATRLPMAAAALIEIAVGAIVPAVGHYVLDRGFRAHPALDGPPDLGALAVLEQPLDRIDRLLRAPEGPGPTVSVVVCTRDRPEALARCLDAIGALDPPPAEAVVVDNAPATDATERVVASRPGVRYVREPRPGLDVARNAGVRHSTGDVVAFTDDDVVVHPRWLAGLRRAFAHADVAAVTGLVLPAALATEAQILFETHWGFNRGYRVRTYDTDYFARTRASGTPVWEIGAGANMAFRREVFDRVGGFDERLDVGAAGCSGDSEIWYRVLAAGATCRYEPTAVVHHVHRERMDGLRRQLFYYMRGHVAALLVQHERTGDRGNLRRLAGSLPRYYLRRTAQAVRGRFRGRHRMLLPEVSGCVSGVGYYLRHRRAPEPDEERRELVAP